LKGVKNECAVHKLNNTDKQKPKITPIISLRYNNLKYNTLLKIGVLENLLKIVHIKLNY